MIRTYLILLLFFVSVSCSTNNDTDTEDLSEYTFFKIAENNSPTSESFILALTDSSQIEHARKIISDPDNTTDRIILAKIVAQNGLEDYQNIDVNNKIAWSWRIDEFIGFVFTTIEIYDGWPGYIEEDLQRWFQNTSDEPNSGIIGFWGFSVVEEIEANQLK
ncbi:MAG: hypothetical protein ACMZ7B_11665 [Balneola sp.]